MPTNLPELTKKYVPQERKAVADELRSLRTQYFEEMSALDSEIERMSSHAQVNRQEVEELKNECSTLDQKITELRSSIFSRLFKRAEIVAGNNQLNSALEHIDEFEKEYFEITLRLEELRDTRSDKGRLRNIRKVLDNFYQDQLKMLPQYEDRRKKELEEAVMKKKENERASSLECVVEDHDVFFVHSISPDFTPGDNSMLEKGTDWRMKLKIMIGFDPAISASTIRKGDGAENFWAHFGVLLRKGSITGAYFSDAATMAIDPNNRTSGKSGENSLAEQVNGAICNRQADGYSAYNEFMVDETEVAGLYIFSPTDVEEKDCGRLSMPSHSDVFEEAEKLKLPVFLFSNGTFYPASFDKKRNKYVIAQDEIEPKNVLLIPQVVNKEVQAMAREEVFEDSPFSMHRLGVGAFEEFSCLQSYAQGRENFIRLSVVKSEMLIGEKEMVDGQMVQTICRFIQPGAVSHMYIGDNGMIINSHTEKNGQVYFDCIQSQKYPSEYVSIGMNTWNIGQFNSVQSYLTRMNDAIQEQAVAMESATDEKSRAFSEKIIKRLSFHCLGFAEQAELLGDYQSAESARNIACPIVDGDKLRELSKRRLGQNGEMRITEDDLYAKKDVRG